VDPRATARQSRDRIGGEASDTSVRTIQRALSGAGRIAYRPMSAPLFNAKQKFVI
jgi:hypothetical protein